VFIRIGDSLDCRTLRDMVPYQRWTYPNVRFHSLVPKYSGKRLCQFDFKILTLHPEFSSTSPLRLMLIRDIQCPLCLHTKAKKPKEASEANLALYFLMACLLLFLPSTTTKPRITLLLKLVRFPLYCITCPKTSRLNNRFAPFPTLLFLLSFLSSYANCFCRYSTNKYNFRGLFYLLSSN
jgi:hypothetical protein